MSMSVHPEHRLHGINSLASDYNSPYCKVADLPEMVHRHDRSAKECYACTFEDLHAQHTCRSEAVHKVHDRLTDVQTNWEGEESKENLP